MESVLWVLAVLLYFVIGVGWALFYTLTVGMEKAAWMGLHVMFWPVVLLLETVVVIAGQFGRVVDAVQDRISVDGGKEG